MIEKIVKFSLENRLIVSVLTVFLVATGFYAMKQLPIDAVPDVTNVQVQILTSSPGLSPLEVEQFITYPVESVMSGLPDLEQVRSVSKFGLSVVTVVFKEHVDIYFARQLINERLSLAREAIPEGYGSPEMGPISTGLGEIYQFEVKGDGYSAMELRSILDWQIAYQLRNVPGVVEINTFGGELKTYQVSLDPNKLILYDLTLKDVFEALEHNNENVGGAYIENNSEQYLIRGEGLIQSINDIENIVITSRDNGTPVLIKNVAKVQFAPMVRQGAVTRDGRGEVVTGIVMMLVGENSRVVVNQVKEKIEEIKKSLPQGVTIDTFYDRTDLVRLTIDTVRNNLIEGGLLVIAFLFLLLGNMRGGIIVALAIPLSMLFAFIGMWRANLSGNLMSLGAIDFGIIVDGAVVMIENIVRVLSEKKPKKSEYLNTIFEAGKEVARPILFSVSIITIVYIPILALTGIEGKMFRPMSLTVIFALIGALILSLTVMPVMASWAFKNGVSEKKTKLLSFFEKYYHPWLDKAVKHKKRTMLTAVGCFLLGILCLPFMGAEFIPKLDEGAIALQAWRLPSVSLEESVKQTALIEKTLKKFPEVITVISKTGRAEIATDPMGVEISDIFVMLIPKDEWTTADTKEELIEKMNEALEKNVPAAAFSYSQPIELRVSELISGVRSDVAIKVYGEDLNKLKEIGDTIVKIISKIDGAKDVKAEQTAGLPMIRVKINRDVLARLGINAKDVLEVIETIGGKTVGEILEGQKRFALQVRFNKNSRDQIDKIKNIPIKTNKGHIVPLSQVATIVIEEGPAQISRENVSRKLTVEANVRGRDIASFVIEAQEKLEGKIPAGYFVEWGGIFKNLETASQKLMIVIPVSLFVIFVMLYLTFKSTKLALLIYLNIPIAISGGIIALFLRGMPLSISAAVGFMALFGIAVMNGVILISIITEKQSQGINAEKAAVEGAKLRLRPVLMTALTDAVGFLPMAIAASAGAEVQKPLATVVIGGVITTTLLTLFVLPTVYSWIYKDHQLDEKAVS